MISPISMDSIFNVYAAEGDEDEPKYRLVGRFLDTDDGLEVLSDYHGILSKLGGPPSEDQNRQWRALVESPYFHVVSLGEIQRGKHPELLKDMNVPKVTGQPNRDSETSTFEYIRHGLRDPLLVQFQGGTPYLSGQELSSLELKQLLDTVSAGQAEIRRYRYSETGIAKMETDLKSLSKMEPRLKAALGAAKSGLDENTYRTLAREIFMDPMVPEMGGKKAWAHALENPQPGIHIRIDGNDFSPINKIHGFEAGNSAIVAMGNAIRDAKREVDQKFAPAKATTPLDPAERDLEELTQSKLYRVGGDEFSVFVPEHERAHEHASAFVRSLRNRLEAIPAIGGTHGLSASIGFGATPEQSDQAQIQAKLAKKAAGYLPGQAKTHVHSLVPGHEGPVPVVDAPAVKPEAAPELPVAITAEPPKAA